MQCPVAEDVSVIYPISEVFDSIQGEGAFAGTRMYFIRLAGCNIGRAPDENDAALVAEQYGILKLKPRPAWLMRCTSWDGHRFLCDTNCIKAVNMTAAAIAREVPRAVRYACITGGEPLLHDLKELVDELECRQVNIHIETSGTIALPGWLTYAAGNGHVWLTVSPKLGVLPSVLLVASEVKLLVDDRFDVERAKVMLRSVRSVCRVYLQPVNSERKLDQPNITRCLDLMKVYPEWRLSLQLHKLLHCR